MPIMNEALAGLATRIIETFNTWQQQRSGLLHIWQQCWDAYLCHEEGISNSAHQRSRLVRPVLFECVEAIHAHIMTSLFPANEPFFSVNSKASTASVSNASAVANNQDPAKTVEQLMRSQLDAMAFREQFALFLKQAIVTGNSIAAIPWVHETQTVRQREPIHLLGVPVGEQVIELEKTIRQGAGFDVLDVADVVSDPSAAQFGDGWIIRRTRRRLSDLKASGLYEHLDGVENWVSSQASKKSSKLLGQLPNSESPMLTVLECWGDLEHDGNHYTNHVCTVIVSPSESTGGKALGRVIRLAPNPYYHGRKPFIFSSFIPVPNEIYGLSPIEKCLGLQQAINTLTNQKLDVINISINNPFTYLINDDVFDPDTVVTSPGALIPVKSHETLRPIQYLNNYTVAFQEIADLKQEVEESTGAFKLLKGGSQAAEMLASRTATEVTAMVEGGAQKLTSILAHFENRVLQPYLDLVLALMRQFASIDLPQIQALSAECCFEITGRSAAISKQQELEGLLSFLKLVQQDADIRKNVNVAQLYRRIYRRLGLSDESGVFEVIDTLSGDATV
jgi:hypothetical protein